MGGPPSLAAAAPLGAWKPGQGSPAGPEEEQVEARGRPAPCPAALDPKQPEDAEVSKISFGGNLGGL